MAKFNPDVSTVTQNNYINASQGMPANKALGTLFKGIGDTVNDFLTEKENRDKLALSRDIDAGVQGIGEAGLGGGGSGYPSGTDLFDTGETPATPDTPGPPTEIERNPTSAPSTSNSVEPIPSELQNAPNAVAKMKASRDQGVMTETQYDLQTFNLIKKLRAKYPQYGPEIERLVTAATGSSILNQLRKDKNAEAAAQASSQSAEEKRKLQIIKDTNEYMSQNDVLATYKSITKRDFDPNNFDEIAWLYAVGGREAEDANVKRTRERLALEKDKKDADKGDIKAMATNEAIIRRDQMLGAAFGADGSDLQPEGVDTRIKALSLSNLLKTNQGGQKPTPEQLQQIEVYTNQLRMEVGLAADRLLTSVDSHGVSYSTFLTDSKDKEDIRKTMLAPIDLISDAIKDNQTGILFAIDNDNKARQAAKDNYVLRTLDMQEQIAEAKALWGAENVNKMLSTVQNDFAQATPEQKAMFHKITLAHASGMTLTDILNMVKEGDITKPTVEILKPMQVWMAMLADPNTPKDKVLDAARKMFAVKENNVLLSFDPNSAETMFNTYMNKGLWEKIKGTDVQDDVYDWGLKQGIVLLKPLADDIVNAQVYSDSGFVIWNPAKQRFDAWDTNRADNKQTQPNAKGRPMPGGKGLIDLSYDAESARKATEAVNRMNRYLDIMQPIIEANGDTVETYLNTVFTSRDYRKLAKEGSLFTRMKEQFYKFMQEGDESIGSKPAEPSYSRRPGKQSSLDDGEYDTTAAKMMNFIAKAEGAGFDTMYGGKKADLQGKTVGEVLKLQKVWTEKTGSSAAGAMQVMRDTLIGLVNKGVLSVDDPYDKTAQYKAGLSLLKEKGYDAWKAGKLPDAKFADRIAGTWAALPLANGRSRYHNDKMGNKAAVSRQAVMELLASLKGGMPTDERLKTDSTDATAVGTHNGVQVFSPPSGTNKFSIWDVFGSSPPDDFTPETTFATMRQTDNAEDINGIWAAMQETAIPPDKMRGMVDHLLGKIPKSVFPESGKEAFKEILDKGKTIPLARLGLKQMDPNRIVLYDPKGEKTNLGGVYTPMGDWLFFSAAHPAAFVHEIMHRSVEQLKHKLTPDERDYLENEVKSFGSGDGIDGNEALVRNLMNDYFPGVEKDAGDASRVQVEAAERQRYNTRMRALKAHLEELANKELGN